MMKKMMLMLSAVLGASVMLSGADAKKPAAAPAKEAAPVMKRKDLRAHCLNLWISTIWYPKTQTVT